MLHLLCVDHDTLHPKQKNSQLFKMKDYKVICSGFNQHSQQ